ncbi:hypothetical protein HDV02_005551 [Globomyces sp. JEL0801]|nr:hypothetical protein HDV02_005551 [Globomyces sp. JEL0801]
MGFFFSKPVEPAPPTQTTSKKIPKSALRNSERDLVEYDQRLDEERAKAKAKRVEEYLKQEKAKYDFENKEPRILILGSSDSGKSTFLKQLKILHGNGFTSEELERAKKSILFSIFTIARTIITQASKEVVLSYEPISKLSIDEAKKNIPDDIFHTIMSMWKDPVIKELYYSYGDLFPLNSQHFFDKLDVLITPQYVLSHDDMLLMRTVTQKISDNIFDVDMNGKTQRIHFFDVSGLKYHRKRWMSYFDDILSIVFVVDISSYDQVLSEDQDINRMVDAINLYDFIVNHPLLTKPDIILFFNKKDLYDIKIKRVSLHVHFPAYTGTIKYRFILFYLGRDFSCSEGLSFLQHEFLKVNKNEKKIVKIHNTCCTDTQMMRKIIKDVL